MDRHIEKVSGDVRRGAGARHDGRAARCTRRQTSP
jgi:hypothetical protein